MVVWFDNVSDSTEPTTVFVRIDQVDSTDIDSAIDASDEFACQSRESEARDETLVEFTETREDTRQGQSDGSRAEQKQSTFG